METINSYHLIRYTKVMVRTLRWMRPEADLDDIYAVAMQFHDDTNDPDETAWPRVRAVISKAVAEALTEGPPTEIPEAPVSMVELARMEEGEFTTYAEPNALQRFVEGWGR